VKKLLWVGDAACPSGFARATHEILDVARHSFDVTVLGINYRGDPHPHPYPIYAAAVGGDMFGYGRLIWMCDLVKPDVIVLQNDPWNIPFYLRTLAKFPEYADVPVVAIVAVDGKNCAGADLNGLNLAVFWTQFGCNESIAGGYKGPCNVIPLGVDTDDYFKEDKQEARIAKGLGSIQDAFIVGNVNRNQPRKRLDLTIKYFAEWIRNNNIRDAYLFLHVAPTGDTGVQIKDLAKYYGIIDRLALVSPDVFYGVPEEAMRETYNCFDVQVTTTQGEGFGLTTFEGMACGVPQIVPAWSALQELTEGCAYQVPCSSTAIGPPYLNIIGGVVDEVGFVSALNKFYRDEPLRRHFADLGMKRAHEDRFNWKHIGYKYTEAFKAVTT